MQSDANQVDSGRNTEEANGRNRPRQKDPSDSPWIEHEIWIFLQEWEVVEFEIGYPGKKIKKKAQSLCSRLYNRGVRKSWNSCLQLMLIMKDLHRTLCDERPRTEPLFSPYASYLFKILGHKSQTVQVPGAPFVWTGNPHISLYPQPQMGMPATLYQPWNSGVPASFGQFHGNSSPMMSYQDSLVPRWGPWNASYPLPVPYALPASVRGQTNFQQI